MEKNIELRHQLKRLIVGGISDIRKFDKILDEIEENRGFKYEYCETQEEVREHIQECEGKHTQQAIYSTFHDALTQVCYGCKKVRTTIKLNN